MGEHISIGFKNYQSHEEQNLTIFTTKKTDTLFSHYVGESSQSPILTVSLSRKSRKTISFVSRLGQMEF